MNDVTGIIEALERCKRYECDYCTEEYSSQCPWDCIAYDELVSKAVALLKEQDLLLKEYRNTIKDGYEALTNATKIIKSEPQIVRCKDCKNSTINSTSYPHCWCSARMEYHDADWFCADGERK